MTQNFRKKLMQMANRLFGRGFSRSAALATAWRLIKCRRLETRVTGTSFDGRQNVIALLAKYHPDMVSVELHREPQNAHDRNAVAVIASVQGKVKEKLGYLPQAVAAVVAAVLDKGLAVAANQLRITGGYGEFQSYGARITVAM